jgi:hypothetical protein
MPPLSKAVIVEEKWDGKGNNIYFFKIVFLKITRGCEGRG